jgi:glycosyltransferase involved in cell wall biosynthesis
VFIAAASPWSKRANTIPGYGTGGKRLPSNVKVGRLSLADLRDLYARSALIVLPLQPVMFQAGITTLLEAMAMGKAVIVTQTKGQTDVVVDGETGIYVPPRDVPALRAAILTLMEDNERRMRLGEAARRLVVNSMSLDNYIQIISRIISELGGHESISQMSG